MASQSANDCAKQEYVPPPCAQTVGVSYLSQGPVAPYPPQTVPGGMYPPPPGMVYPPPQPPGMAVSFQTCPPTTEVVIRSPQPQTQAYVVAGGSQCPKCRVGIIQEDFTPLGICCAILFFPLGIICCITMRQRRCSYCATLFI